MLIADLLATLALIGWLGLILAPWQPWRIREILPNGNRPGAGLEDVTVLIPARNEAGVIGATLQALRAQGAGLRILVVDDQSADDTAGVVERSDAGVELLQGEPPPAGWSGKLWALQQGIAHIHTPLTLLLDADIALAQGVIPRLKRKLRADRLSLVSVMARLRTDSGWERLLMPAFVYFFRLLYPFSLSNSPASRVAAAAGGCMLLETRLLKDDHVLGKIRQQLIDDCALAREIKLRGNRIWIGLSPDVMSLRSSEDLSTIAAMVSRTAYSQLRHSAVLLGVCTLAMLLMFCGPLLWMLPIDGPARLASLTAFGLMCASYLPMLRFYRLHPAYAALLPLTAVLYLGMTWMSAFNHWRGKGAVWKERSYRGAAS